MAGSDAAIFNRDLQANTDFGAAAALRFWPKEMVILDLKMLFMRRSLQALGNGLLALVPRGTEFRGLALLLVAIAVGLHIGWQSDKGDTLEFWSGIVFGATFLCLHVGVNLDHVRAEVRPLPGLVAEQLHAHVRLVARQEAARAQRATPKTPPATPKTPPTDLRSI